MNVAYILGSLNCGGAEMLLLDVFQNASKASYEFIGIHRKGGVLQTNFESTGIPFYSCSLHHNVMRYIFQLRHLCQQKQITLIHTQMPIDCIFAKIAIIGLPCRLVTTFHGFDMGSKWLERLRNRLAICCADKVCFVSQNEQKDYEVKYYVGNKGVVIYNGVDFEKILKKKESETERNGGSIITSKSLIRLCMVGSFGGGRSHIVICKALRYLSEHNNPTFNQLDFYFIGAKRTSEPQYYDECVEYCRTQHLDNVHFLGGRSDVPQLLHQMDGFVYSTVHDTFGIAVVEAMAAGLPVIVNDWEVMKEITHDGKWATLFKTEDAEDCANKIQDLIEHLAERKEKARQIAKEVREEYSIEKHIARLNAIYSDVLGENK